MLRFTFIFLLLLPAIEITAKSVSKKEIVSKENATSYIFFAGEDISKLVFNMSEVFLEEKSIPMSVVFEETTRRKLTLTDESGGVLITDNLQFLGELRKDGYINFAYVTPLFSERLIRVPLQNERFTASEIKQEAIFLKTAVSDREILESSKSFIPSVFIPSSVICEGISDLSISYKSVYRNIILKQNTAKKCNIKAGTLFEEEYKVYYMALLIKNNFNISYKVFDFLKSSKKIKEIIKQNGYDS